MDEQILIERAVSVRENAYAPYSNFRVGAALIAASGNVYWGCNVENASYGLTVCAERSAVFAAAAANERSIVGIAVASSNGCLPCGACLQVLAEFARDLPIWLVNVEAGNTIRQTTLRELLPAAFALEKARSTSEGSSKTSFE